MTRGAAAAQAGSLARAGVFWQGGDARWQPRDLVPLTTTVHADICIVGGGFTGLWAALYIKRLDSAADVVLIEREYCGAGASGRNGGWVNGWDKSLPRIVSRFGKDAAPWLLEASRRSVSDIRDTVRDGEIDCDFAMEGGLVVAASAAQAEAMRATAQAASDLGRDDLLRVLGRDEAQDLCGSPLAVAGELVLHAGSVQPALLVQGLRRLVVEAGVRVFEASPMLALERTRPAVVKTPSGAVVAGKVVLAAGSWLARLPELRRTLFIIPSHMVATAPSREALDRLGWVKGRPFSDNRTAVHYAQRTGDDRLAFGRGGGRLGYGGRIIPEHFHDPREIGEIVADMHAMLPLTRELAVEWRWGGPVERSQHGLPWVGTLGTHGNVHYGVGYSGNGVAPSNLIGRTLASVALGLNDEYAASPLVSEPPTYLPPEPFCSVGARVVRNAVERCEIVEDEGRTPDRMSRVLRRGLDYSMPKSVLPTWPRPPRRSG